MNKNARLCRFALQRTIITALLALIAIAGQAQNFNWRLEGTVDNAAPSDTLTIIDSERHQPIATIQVKNGAIVPASGVLEKPAVCRIAKKGRRGSIGIFVLEEGTTKISIDLDKAYVLKVGGTPVNNDLATFIDEQNRRTDNHAAYREMWLAENSRLIATTLLSLLMTFGIISIINNVQDILQMRVRLYNGDLR